MKNDCKYRISQASLGNRVIYRCEGKHYYLKTLFPEDVTETYVSWLRDAEVTRYLDVHHIDNDLESTKMYVSSYDNVRTFIFGVYTYDNRHIGNGTLYNHRPVHGTIRQGLMIGDRDYWGKQAGREASELLNLFAFEKLLCRKVTAGAPVTNLASIINLKIVGFQVEGTLKRSLKVQNEYVDELCFALFREDWMKGKNHG